MKISGGFVNLGPNYGGKGVFLGLSHFFYVEANVRISYMGTFFKLWFSNFAQGILSILQTMCENFLRFRPFWPELWGKWVFPKMGLSHFSTFSTLRQM